MGVIRLAVDAMGGDYAPAEIVAGAIQGARELGLAVALVGDPEAVRRELRGVSSEDLSLEVVPAHDVIHMDQDPVQAVRSLPDSSINVACRLVLEGRAEGVLTMGHTGAGMVAALSNFGRIPGIERPAVIVPFLGIRHDLYLLDVGANADVRPTQLLQFALMGSAYAQYVGGISNPRVGLLSNGSEPNKGNKIGKQAYALLSMVGDLNFIGNVEPHALVSSDVNVVVSDGFAGNVLLKATEGMVANLLAQFRELLPGLPADSVTIVESHLEKLQTRYHYASYGAATLLGVQYPMFIGHGRSEAWAVRNGMATAMRMISGDVINKIEMAVIH
ncbi:MAG: phosphate acyltransferase PlsX [Anaerolineales bacterium]